MSPDGPIYSVIVVSYDNLATTVRCVESLRRHWHSETEVIFVDNGSKDGTTTYLTEIARQLGQQAAKTVFLARNEGWCRGVNAGLARASGRYLVLLNNDVVVTPDWLAGLRECLEEAHAILPGARRVGMVGPVTNAAGGPQGLHDVPAYDPATLDDHARRHREASRRNWASSFFLSGFCMMLRRELFEEVGGLDERFSPGGYDDNDLVLRAQERGWEAVIAGDVYLHHEGSVTFRTAHPEMQSGLVNRGLFYQKWRERNAGPRRLVAAYRVKNGEGTLEESLEATARFADHIVVLDDGSSDGTRRICERAGVSRYAYQELPFDERRDRNRVLAMAAEMNPDWVIAIDADEIFEMDRPRAERLMHLTDPHVKALGFHWYTFWEPTRAFFRADGIFGNMSGYRMYKHEPGFQIVAGTDNGLHCGNIPQLPNGGARFTNVRVRHLGYDSPPLRQKKLDFYRRMDLAPRPELVGNSDYSHLASGTVTLRRYAPQSGVSLCLIVKNEAERLETFLATLEPFVDEICLVDNGSDDDTLAVARRFTDRIERMPTPDLELDGVRNRALEMASRPWILSLDPDEEISPPDLPGLQRLMDDVDTHAYAFRVANHQKDGPPVLTLAVRLFRNDPRIRYARPIHETVERSLLDHPELVRKSAEIVIQHYGFLKQDADVESKLGRYYARNRKYREDNPGDAMAWYNEALHLLNDGSEEEAVMFLVRAMQLDPTFLSPRSQLAYVFQERAQRLWLSMLDGASPEHPVRAAAQESLELLRRITPPRPYVGNARTRRTP